VCKGKAGTGRQWIAWAVLLRRVFALEMLLIPPDLVASEKSCSYEQS
jgi:hypothetical protein